MKKKEYIQPEFEIVLLEQENVVTGVSGEHWDGPGMDDIDTALDNPNTNSDGTFAVVW